MRRLQLPQTAAMACITAMALAGMLGLSNTLHAKTHDVKFTAMETEIVVEGTGTKYKAWTFNGQSRARFAFLRAGLVFAFNFHPLESYFSYSIDAPPGKYRIILDSDSRDYGGHGRIAAGHEHFTLFEEAKHGTRNMLQLYLPTRTAVVLQPE